MNSVSRSIIDNPIANYPSATVACFDATCGALPRRKLDEKRLRRFLSLLADQGVPALLIGASTGQGHLRTVDELVAWYSCARDANLGNALPIALLRPEDGTARNAAILDLLLELQYPIVLVRPGTDLPSHASDSDVAANMRGVVEQASERGFAIGLYSIPDVSGNRLTARAAMMLIDGAGGESVVSIKVTDADYYASTWTFLQESRLQHLKIVQGWDPHILRSLRDGPKFDEFNRQRCGITSGAMSLALFQYQYMLEQANEELWDDASRAQKAVSALFASMQDVPGQFADLQRAKYIMGLGHPLADTVEPPEVGRVLKTLLAISESAGDRSRIARSLNLMGDGPYCSELSRLAESGADQGSDGFLARGHSGFTAGP